MAVVTISRQFGAGGRTLAESLARRINYQFVHTRIVNRIAKEANVSVNWVKSVEKHSGDWLMRFTSRLVSSDFIDRHVGESRSDFDEKNIAPFSEVLFPL